MKIEWCLRFGVVTDLVREQTWQIWGGVGSADGCVGVTDCLTIFFPRRFGGGGGGAQDTSRQGHGAECASFASSGCAG